jgi:hypothetical protein
MSRQIAIATAALSLGEAGHLLLGFFRQRYKLDL